MTTEIPVWLDGRCRWVSGICRKTTVNDVLTALLRADTPPAGPGAAAQESATVAARTGTPSLTAAAAAAVAAIAPDPSGYVIVERWRGVERRLDARVRIFKVWMAWADAQSDVQFLVRRVAERSKRRCRRSASSSVAGAGAKATTLSGVSGTDGQDHAKANGEIERLMCLILRQGETIQNQLRRLRDREMLIERLEGETHAARVAALGANYVLAAYLGDEAEAGATAPAPTPAALEETSGPGGGVIEADDTRRRIALWEKVVKVNKRLQEQEERLVRLHVGLRRFADDRDAATALDGALRRAQDESDAGRRDLAASGGLLADAEILLAAKRRLLRRLQSELEAADTEATKLAFIASSQCAIDIPVAATQQSSRQPASSGGGGKDPDSNSDTGLSSLHSSSEEGVCILDTLV